LENTYEIYLNSNIGNHIYPTYFEKF